LKEKRQMATIKIADIIPAGAELFTDFESFMNDLGNDELAHVQGGLRHREGGFHSLLSIVC
jgi:hypothetical protein